ncbi:uncharacterized protein PV06_08071 [Exophiala oligosperma]|uniref:Uncharacterized protein n=1 Tax=Exophiala oligosperma TaxID=215243 RepID=A0A0D2DAL7_9EURO|nr:uncharacterized protein PV06_08071 [Exophiala oligosperma]KIW39460.1 hypothetical protein PV06_08071 [Exophiala oligosperma]
MCKAHVLRFCCGHGILMGLEVCNVGPCPILKTTGLKLPQQPYKCYNCQNRMSTTSVQPTSPRDGCSSSIASLDSNSSGPSPPSSPLSRTSTKVMAPLPGVARQPAECAAFGRRFTRTDSFSCKSFSFSCASSGHYPAPHYMGLPTHLPHQNHPCPPCQLEDLRMKSDREAILRARAEHPHLTSEKLVRNNGRQWEEWQPKPTLEAYIDEKRSDERQMWLFVTRKWTQDLKKSRVLVAEEDGLGLLG